MHSKITFPLVPLGILSNIMRTELYTFLTHMLVFLTQRLSTIKARIITSQFITKSESIKNQK